VPIFADDQERNRADSLFARNYPATWQINHEGKIRCGAYRRVHDRRQARQDVIRTLRRTYGAHFAEGCRDDERLNDVLHKIDKPSPNKLLHDHERGKLDQICRDAADERTSPRTNGGWVQ
jgi:hypothetical protein